MAVTLRSLQTYASGALGLVNHWTLTTPVCQAGDLLIAVLAVNTHTDTFVLPAGWVRVVGVDGPDGFDDGVLLVCRRWATALDAAGGAGHTWSAGVISTGAGGILAFTNVDPVDPVFDTATDRADVMQMFEDPISVGPVDVPAGGGLALYVASKSGVITFGVPAGMTGDWAFNSGHTTANTSTRVAHLVLAAGGGPAYGPVGGSGPPVGSYWDAALVMLKAYVAPPVPVPVPDPALGGWAGDGDGWRVVLYRRDFSGPVRLPMGVRIEVQRYAWVGNGGPAWAVLRVVGPTPGSWEAAEWLRYAVEVYSPSGDLVWWGFVNSLRMGTGGASLGVGLEGMANRVAGRYSLTLPAGPPVYTSALTPWADDLESQGEFGVKERIVHVPGHDLAAATAERDRELASYGLPPATIGGAAGGGLATLYCRGWWDTLSWRYYAQPAGLVEWTAAGQNQGFGNATYNAGWAQCFDYSGDAWVVADVQVQLAYTMDGVQIPSDGVKITLCEDAGGVPGGGLGEAVVDAGELSTAAAWVQVALTPAVTLSTGRYWLVLQRTGGIDFDRYYRFWVDEANGFRGPLPMAVLNNTVWTLQTVWACMGFRIRGVQPAGWQVAQIVEGVGQFLTGWELEGLAIGAASCQWRAGNVNGLTEAERLLGSGCGAGRLLAKVRGDRVVEVMAAPSSAAVGYWLAADGSIGDEHGARVPDGQGLAGCWVGLGDVIPGNADVSHYGRVAPFWVEGSVYDVAGRRLRLLGAGAKELVAMAIDGRGTASGVGGDVAF